MHIMITVTHLSSQSRKHEACTDTLKKVVNKIDGTYLKRFGSIWN
jgi:hypothetical protein